MNRKTIAIIALQAFIIVVLFWMLVFYGKDEYEAGLEEEEEVIASPSHVTSESGMAAITLPAASQRLSGIATTTLHAATHQAEHATFATVVGMDTLLELRTRYLAARAETGVVQASLANSRQDYQRLAELNRDDRNVSDRAVAAAHAAWQADEAKLAAIDAASASLRDAMSQQWGDTLAGWAVQQPPGEAMRRLLQHRDVLIQVTLPPDAPAPAPATPLLVTLAGNANAPLKAEFVSPSPQTDAVVQGKTYYYHAPADQLRTGMRLAARLADRSKNRPGVIVPMSAVVWYANLPWIYQKQGEDKFVRRRISADIETEEGWFNAGLLQPGDEIVTTGAQLLLSEEFKYQIKNENED